MKVRVENETCVAVASLYRKRLVVCSCCRCAKHSNMRHAGGMRTGCCNCTMLAGSCSAEETKLAGRGNTEKRTNTHKLLHWSKFNNNLVGMISNTSMGVNGVRSNEQHSCHGHEQDKFYRACVGNHSPTLKLRTDHAVADLHSPPQAD